MNRNQLLAVVILALALLLAHSQNVDENKMMRTEKNMQKTDVKLLPKQEKREDKLEKTDKKQKQNKKPSENFPKPEFEPKPTPKNSRRQMLDKVDKPDFLSSEDPHKPEPLQHRPQPLPHPPPYPPYHSESSSSSEEFDHRPHPHPPRPRPHPPRPQPIPLPTCECEYYLHTMDRNGYGWRSTSLTVTNTLKPNTATLFNGPKTGCAWGGDGLRSYPKCMGATRLLLPCGESLVFEWLYDNPRKPCPNPLYARGDPDRRRWCTEDRKFYEIEEQVDDQIFLLVTETMKVNKQVILTCNDYQGDGTASTIRFQ